MIDDSGNRRWNLGGGLSASVIVHVAVVALLVFGLPPLSLPEAPQEEAIAVELVPPPEPVAEEPEEAQAQPPPEPPAEEPAPPPPPPAETPPPEEPPPSVEEEPQQAQTETPSSQAEQPSPQRVLDPVVQYGETDSGPRESPEGDSAQEAASAETEAEAEPEAQPPALPEVLAAQGAGSLSLHLADPAATEAPTEDERPDETDMLFSRESTSEVVATRAVGNLTRDVRGRELCASQLSAQLRRGSPPYFASQVPSLRLPEGSTVIDMRREAFQANGQWYNVSFRCEVDADATRVVSFAYRVGAPVPRDQWAARGFPQW